MTADYSEVRRFEQSLAMASGRLGDEARGIVKRGAQNVKNEMVAEARAAGGRFSRVFPGSISYSMKGNAFYSEAEIGPDKGRPQGALGNLLYFGSRNNGAVLDVEVGLRKEAPELERRLGEVATEVLE